MCFPLTEGYYIQPTQGLNLLPLPHWRSWLLGGGGGAGGMTSEWAVVILCEKASATQGSDVGITETWELGLLPLGLQPKLNVHPENEELAVMS